MNLNLDFMLPFHSQLLNYNTGAPNRPSLIRDSLDHYRFSPLTYFANESENFK